MSNSKPLSLEVFADDKDGMINQAKILNSLGKNIYVKIPISFTNGNFTHEVISELSKQNIKMNITAIFTIEQIRKILPIVKNQNAILSVFAGRIFDCGKDANMIMKKSAMKLKILVIVKFYGLARECHTIIKMQ